MPLMWMKKREKYIWLKLCDFCCTATGSFYGFTSFFLLRPVDGKRRLAFSTWRIFFAEIKPARKKTLLCDTLSGGTWEIRWHPTLQENTEVIWWKTRGSLAISLKSLSEDERDCLRRCFASTIHCQNQVKQKKMLPALHAIVLQHDKLNTCPFFVFW